jgi:predicted dinucleotide-binding enzyme
MRIAIVAAGAVGATLGQAWLTHGEYVIWGLRNPADPKYAVLPKDRACRQIKRTKFSAQPTHRSGGA